MKPQESVVDVVHSLIEYLRREFHRFGEISIHHDAHDPNRAIMSSVARLEQAIQTFAALTVSAQSCLKSLVLLDPASETRGVHRKFSSPELAFAIFATAVPRRSEIGGRRARLKAGQDGRHR